MTAGLARTRREALLYLDLHPCERCGGTDTAWESSLVQVDGELVRSYAGACGGCGERREVLFRLPDPGTAPSPAEGVVFGGERPSDLLDAGEWLWVADRVASSVPTDDPPKARYVLGTAAAAVDEALKFIPSGGESVPDAGFWSDRGLLARSAEPDRFDRERLEIVRDTYRQSLAELARAERAGPPLARTADEANLYLDLRPCERCGSVETPWDSGLTSANGALARSYAGRCDTCGLEREFVFRVPDPPLDAPAGARVYFGDDRASELLDAGEWLWVADLAATNAPADDPDGEAQALAIAAGAIEEIIKFVPEGAERVPGSGFWSERGRRVRDEAPGRFDLDRLRVVADSYRRQLVEVEGRS